MNKLFILEGSLQEDGDEEDTWGILFYATEQETLINYLKMVAPQVRGEQDSWGTCTNQINVVGHQLKIDFIQTAKSLGYEILELPRDDDHHNSERMIMESIKSKFPEFAPKAWSQPYKIGDYYSA